MRRLVSQYGLPNYRQNPKQRNRHYGAAALRNTLASVNEGLAKGDLYLHPTKGFRRLNTKRTHAAVLSAEIRAGGLPYSLKMLRKQMQVV